MYYAFIMEISPDEFKHISMCDNSKRLGIFLKSHMRLTIKMLITRFEEIKMKDNEYFDEFYVILNDIVNFVFNIGEGIPILE